MISVPCPHCDDMVLVGDELAGQHCECPACGKTVAIPAASELAAATTAHQRPPAPPPAVEPPSAAPGAPAPAVDPSGQTVADGAQKDAAGRARELTDFLAAPQAPDEIGRLGPYRVLALLGRGGMGVVFRAEDPGLRRLVALKAMLPALADNESNRRRFLREGRAAAAVKDDHVVGILQVGEDRGVPFVAMEYLEGEPLDARLRREPKLSPAEIVRIGHQTALGLAAAHDKGLIHRDVKPGNLWLERRGRRGGDARFRVKILDFGLVRAGNDDVHLTQSGVIVGTPAYMSPEQADGRRVDGRSDLFSLGCVLYRLCTGAMPFQGDGTLALLSALARVTPKPPRALNPDVPPALSDLVMRLLGKKPEERPQSAEAVAAALEEIETEMAAQDGPVKKRKPLVWLAGVVACLALLGLLAFLWLHRPDQPGDEPPAAVVVSPRFPALDGAWVKRVRALPAEEQVKEVAAELRRRNLGFDGDVKYTAPDGVVRRLEFAADHITDLSSVWVLAGLRVLVCSGSDYGKGRLTDLSPLAEMDLTELRCFFTKVTDLSPLRGMKLQTLDCHMNEVSDLRPLQGMPLVRLDISVTKVSDLSPLRGMRLTTLKFPLTPVTDLSPLEGMKLEQLEFHGTFPSDLSLLRGMPLKSVSYDFRPERDAELLGAIKTLETINGKPAAEFLKELEAKKGKP
jgi:serine/threonine protein kinase